MSTVGSKREQKKSSCLNPPQKNPPISSSQCFPREPNLHFSMFFFHWTTLHPYFHAPGWFPASRHPSSDGSSSRIPRSRHTWDPWWPGANAAWNPWNFPQLWPCLPVITGYFYGIIHSINGVFLVLVTDSHGHNCNLWDPVPLSQLSALESQQKHRDFTDKPTISRDEDEIEPLLWSWPSKRQKWGFRPWQMGYSFGHLSVISILITPFIECIIPFITSCNW